MGSMLCKLCKGCSSESAGGGGRPILGYMINIIRASQDFEGSEHLEGKQPTTRRRYLG